MLHLSYDEIIWNGLFSCCLAIFLIICLFYLIIRLRMDNSQMKLPRESIAYVSGETIGQIHLQMQVKITNFNVFIKSVSSFVGKK